MGMRINTNLDALNAQRNLMTTGLAYSKSVQKLSSGMRINSAADDAAGLTISEKLRSQTAGLGQATRNAQDGISMIQTGEGALNETASILQRMRELTVQGGNDTLQTSDRGAIKAEMDQLSSEIGRISGTTQFNGITLLNGTLSAKGTLGSVNSSGASGLTGLNTTTLLTAATKAPSAATSAVVTAASALATIGVSGVLSINNVAVSLTAGHSAGQTVSDINNTVGLGATGAVTASLDATNHLVLTSNTPGSGGSVSVGTATGAGNTIYSNLGLTGGMNTVTGQDAPTNYAAAGSYTVNLTQSAAGTSSTGKFSGITLAASAATAQTYTSTSITGVPLANATAAQATDVGTLTINGTTIGIVASTAGTLASSVGAANTGTSLTAAGAAATLVINGTTIGVAAGGNVLTAINGSAAGVTATMNGSTLTLTSTTAGSVPGPIAFSVSQASGGTLGVDLGMAAAASTGVVQNLAPTNTAGAGVSNSLISQINAQSGTTGVTATLTSGVVTFGSTSTGVTPTITVTATQAATSGTLLQDLGLKAGVSAGGGTPEAPGAGRATTVAGSAAGTSGSGTLTLNGVDVLLTSGNTQAQVVTQINSSKAGVSATLNGVGDLVLTSTAKGSASAISIAAQGAAGNTLLHDLGLSAIASGATTADALVSVAGTDAAGTYTAPGTTTAVAFAVSNGSTLSGGGVSTDASLLNLATVAATTGSITGNNAMASTIGAGAGASTLTINGVGVSLAANSTITSTLAAINASAAGVVASTSGGKLVLTFATAGSAGGFNPVTITSNQASAGTSASIMADLGLGSAAQVSGTAGVANASTTTAGTDKAGTVATNNSYTFTDTNKSATLQIGANSGQTLGVGIEDMSAVALGVANLDVSSSAAINKAATGTLALIDTAIATVSQQRATLGAYQNRLEHTISNLGVSQSNLTASESRIRDVDMAAEMVNFTKTGILQQAGQAILAQANQSGSGVMSLLR
jgi:flagellin